MTTFLLYVLATIGFANILVHGTILDLIQVEGLSVRKWMHTWEWSKQLFSCYECSGFWSGMICGLALYPTTWWLFLIYGFAGSVLARTYNDLSDWLISSISFEVNSGEEQS